MSLRFGSRVELRAARARVAGVLVQWLRDGFDGASAMGDDASGFHDTALRITAVGETLWWPVDLGQHGPGGVLAVLERLGRLLDGLGLHAELGVHASMGGVAFARDRHVEVSSEELADLTRVGGSRVEVRMFCRLNTGGQRFDLQHDDPAWLAKHWSSIEGCLQAWHRELVDAGEVSATDGGQPAPLRIYRRGGGLITVDTRLGFDPLGALRELVVTFAELFDRLGSSVVLITYERSLA